MLYSVVLQTLCASVLPFWFFRVIATFRISPFGNRFFFSSRFIHTGALSGIGMNIYKKPYRHRSLEKHLDSNNLMATAFCIKTETDTNAVPCTLWIKPLYCAYTFPFQSPPLLFFLFIYQCLALVTAYQVRAQANRASHRLSRTPAI